MISPLTRTWKALTAAEQATFIDASARLGLGLMPVSREEGLQRGVDLAKGFVRGQVFHRGTLYFDPQMATVDDLAHDLGHALGLSPAQRAAFAHPEGDIETSEDVAMVVQWALVRAVLPHYDLAASMDDFGYNFGYQDHTFALLEGADWARQLEAGQVVRGELAIYCHLQALGLVSAPPRLRPPVRRADWETGPEWLPGWAEAAHAHAIRAALQPIGGTPSAAPRRRRSP